MNEITNTSSTPTVQFHPDKPKKTVADWVRDMRMSPSVNEKNTGIKTDQVTPDLMLATSKKLLDISRGKQEPDPKDSLDFQRFYGPAEYFAEHILRDGGKLGRNLLWKATNKGNLDFMATNALDKHISSVFYDSKLAQMMDGASPLETVDSAYKMTRLGEGGIGDIDSAPDEMRTVQPSYFGFIDPVRCYAAGTEVLTEQGWRPIELVKQDEKVWTLEDGIPDFRPVKETYKFSYTGPMVSYEDDLVAFSVTPHHRMHVKIDGKWTKRYAEEVYNTSAVINVGEKLETAHQLLDSKWAMQNADGHVYCITVPGGIFYCRYKKLHGLWCGNSPESLRVGLDMYATKNVMKGSDGRLYQKFINARTGKEELVDSEKAARSVVASSEMRNANTKSIFALGGPTGVRIVPKSSVDYYLPRADEAYSTSSNLVPMLSAVKEMRLLMGCLHPQTPILTLSNKNEINIVPAQEVTAKNMSIPGSDKDGQSKLYDMRNSIAKFPPKRFWFKKITLMSGRTIVTSYDHKWPIIKNGKMVLQEARKLKEGDTVLRTTFKDVPSRRTFTRRTYVSSNVGYTMGLMARSLYLPDKGKIRFQLPHGYNCLAIEDALISLGVKEFSIYNKMGSRYLGITDPDFINWIDKVMGIRPENRRIPSFILSARVDVVGSFINGYTLDKNLVGQDALESYWILELPNVLFRDSIAFLLSRIGTDCLYRECHRDGQLSLALRLVEPNPAWGDMILDSIKSVQNAQSCPIMIDIDIDDNMYVTASGILTHNSKYPLQAVSLEARETPLVRTLDEATGKSMQQLIGKYLGAQYAKQGGTVTAVRKDRIDVLYDDGTKGSVPLYVNFPMNAKGYISNTPSVKAGDAFKPGQLLAYSNYTDKNGDAAMGINLRSAYMSWKGGTYEDAVVISESAANKLKSTTMYKTAVDLDRTVKLGKQNYMTWKPAEYTKEQMDLLDDNGIVKPGTVLHKGDPMILAVQTTEPSPGTMGKRILSDMSETWEHDHPGVVTDVVKTRKGVKVFATVTAPAEIGDKLAGLYGNKGMIAQIVPDDQMPHNAKGEPIELIMSPLGITSRTNPSQLFEAQLGKVARKTGKPEMMPPFMDQDIGEYVLNRLKQNHLSPDEDLIDPETGRTIKDVFTGVSYFHKLKHLAESKMSARGTDEYTAEGLPGGKGMTGSKRFGTLEQGAMVGHGAFDIIKDSKVIRGQSNSDFWRSIRTGGIPTMPGEPLVHKKFFAHLQGSGVNVRRTPRGVSVFALSNGDIDQLAGSRELKSRDTYEAHNFRPIDGGLFGQDIFGMNGDKWAYIKLDEPLPNPVMEEPLARLLNMSDKDFVGVCSGEKEVNGMSSAADVKARLANVDLEAEAAKALQDYKNANNSSKDKMLKRYVAIERMRRGGVQPADFMLDKIPVLPPQFRPVSTHNGLTMVADSNYLYAQLLDARDDLRESKDLPKSFQDEARRNVYDKWKELTGLYEPEDVKLREKHVQGLLKWALGTSPKFSGFQRKVLSATVDTVGRGAVIPDPRVKLNQLGIPREMAFNIMAPLVERGLVKRGYSPIDAMKMVKERKPQAEELLKEVMKTHPVLMNRAPTLHKLGIMAFDPVLVNGHVIHVNPSIVSPFGMDFDGDTICGEWLVMLDLEKLKENREIFDNSGKIGLTFANSVLYYGIDQSSGNHNSTEGDQAMLEKSTKARFSAAVCSPAELPLIPGSAVQKSPTVTEWDVAPGVYTATIDLDGQRIIAPVTKVSRHTQLKMFDVTTSVSGHYSSVITASDDHSLIAINRETLEFEKVRPEDAVGMLLPRLRRDESISHDTCQRYIMIDKPYEANRDLGLFIGMMLGDGWVSSNNQAMLAACDESVQKEFLRLLDPATTKLPVMAQPEVHSYAADEGRFSQNPAQRIDTHLETQFKFKLRDLIGVDAWNKRIPAQCLRGSRAHLCGILCGLLATDGSVNFSAPTKGKKAASKSIAIHTTSPELRDGIIQLCSSLGIRASATVYMGAHSKHTCYSVTLSIIDMIREYTKSPVMLTIPCEHKAEAIKQMVAEKRKYNGGGTFADIVPFPACLGAEISWAKAANPACVSEWRANGYVSTVVAKRMVGKLRQADWSKFKEYGGLPNDLKRNHTPEQAAELVETWCTIVDASDFLSWVHVDKVTPSVCTEGWDCTVPGPYTFSLFDGTIVQDTVNIHAPVTDKAIQEAKAKMFPERNLIAMRNREILYKPEKEYQQGLYLATHPKTDPNVRLRTFRSIDEARQAYRQGLLDINDPIEIKP